MEELIILRKLVEEHDYAGALTLIDELEEMAMDDKLNKLESYVEVMLIHLIKQRVEKRILPLSELAISTSLFKIHLVDRRRKTGGRYLTDGQIREAINDAYWIALRIAADEGIHSPGQLAAMLDPNQIKQDAFDQIMAYRPQALN